MISWCFLRNACEVCNLHETVLLPQSRIIYCMWYIGVCVIAIALTIIAHLIPNIFTVQILNCNKSWNNLLRCIKLAWNDKSTWQSSGHIVAITIMRWQLSEALLSRSGATRERWACEKGQGGKICRTKPVCKEKKREDVNKLLCPHISVASHTLHRERKVLVALQPFSCPYGRNLMWPIRSPLFVVTFVVNACHGVQLCHKMFSGCQHLIT